MREPTQDGCFPFSFPLKPQQTSYRASKKDTPTFYPGLYRSFGVPLPMATDPSTTPRGSRLRRLRSWGWSGAATPRSRALTSCWETWRCRRSSRGATRWGGFQYVSLAGAQGMREWPLEEATSWIVYFGPFPQSPLSSKFKVGFKGRHEKGNSWGPPCFEGTLLQRELPFGGHVFCCDLRQALAVLEEQSLRMKRRGHKIYIVSHTRRTETDRQSRRTFSPRK